MNEVIDGRYKLIKRLGVGGMAEVFLAEQSGPRGFARRTVIKRIHRHMAEEERFVKSFEDEARLAALLQHPNIVRTEDFGDDNGQLFLVLEYVEGEDLRTVAHRTHGRSEMLPLNVVLQVGLDMAEALDFAHKITDSEGVPLAVVHRDVSPQNIMVTPAGQGKLLDFGIARAASNQQHTQTGVLKGKVAYFSPEQARGEAIDGRTDQFALAVVIYELLASGRLFLGNTEVTTLSKVLRCYVPSVRDFRAEIPEKLDTVLRRALSPDRQHRYPDCAAFADALGQCLEDAGGRWDARRYGQWRTEIFADATDASEAFPLLVPDGGGTPVFNPDEQTRVAADPRSGEVLPAPNPANDVPTIPGFGQGREQTEEATEFAASESPSKSRLVAVSLVLLVLSMAAWFFSGTNQAETQRPAAPPRVAPVSPVKPVGVPPVTADAGPSLPQVSDSGPQAKDSDKAQPAAKAKTRRKRSRRTRRRSSGGKSVSPKAAAPVTRPKERVVEKKSQMIVPMTRRDFDAVLISRLPKLRRCKKTAQDRAAGTAKVSVSVGADGRTSGVRVSGASPSYAACLKKEVKRWRFVKRGGEPQRFGFPF